MESETSRGRWTKLGVLIVVVVLVVTAGAVAVWYFWGRSAGNECGTGGDYTGYEAEPLDLSMNPVALSANGEYVLAGITNSSEGESRGFELWHDGETSSVTDVPGAGDESAYVLVADVNSSGTVVGHTFNGRDESESRSWKYEDGGFTVLKGTNEYLTEQPAAVNDSGVIVGSGVRWEAGETTPTKVDLDSPYPGEVPSLGDVSEDGSIMGTLGGSEDDSELYDYQLWVWDAHGEGEKVHEAEALGARAIAGDWVVVQEESDGPASSYRWNRASGGKAKEIGFAATSVDECGNAFGGSGDGPAAYTDEVRPLPAPRGSLRWTEPKSEARHEVTAASADGRTLLGGWKGHPVMWVSR